jgi:hypothetical protein
MVKYFLRKGILGGTRVGGKAHELIILFRYVEFEHLCNIQELVPIRLLVLYGFGAQGSLG